MVSRLSGELKHKAWAHNLQTVCCVHVQHITSAERQQHTLDGKPTLQSRKRPRLTTLEILGFCPSHTLCTLGGL